MAREQWGTRAGFIMAAIGSAIGLGNIWRFPYVAYDNGGGAFFLAYLFAILTAGIPLLLMEFSIGQKFRGSSPLSFARINKKTEWLGWWQVAISFVVATYYSVIIAWALSYMVFSFNQSWGSDTQGFFLGDYLEATEAGVLGGLNGNVLIPLIIVWAGVFVIMLAGVKKGIEWANRIFIPLLVVMFLAIVVRALTLEGAVDGLDVFFRPDWQALAQPGVWVAAYGHIFFSLSIGFAIMITYASYLPKKEDLNNSAFITAFSNGSFELLAGIGIFATLGFMAGNLGVPVAEVATSGIGLAFIAIPEIINTMPGFNGLFGVLFFGCLVLAGITSLISITETYIAGVQDKFKVSRTKSVIVGGGLSAIISLLYATRGGINVLDAVDNFINQFGIAFAGLVSVIIVAWILRKLDFLQGHMNEVSDFRIGSWWKFSLMFITPLVLGANFVLALINNIRAPYEDMPLSFLAVSGWGVAGAALVVGLLLSLIKWPPGKLEAYKKEGGQ
ncbi:sodium-dependent transporter [Shouchella clausii]|uniref:Transporter n=1 Tax=Shouchella clausii TaxID=79880 RepID=A0A268RUN2_SHOCL|nr:sodium-dependent transporter [Shouchella clausii]PAD41811.1 sodium-dependent transporter [Bacillus sp. 7520-S]AST97824.1 sodium-dependent transporter [Shouchella clausii]MBU8598184.1 sodium-dependent transporter [Shouchella clausii]MCY1106898.1 sodium-dependent transporter [Shouchella clausii]MEB5474164.1 sodium-dependent transporter [Shouchella clausii]